MSAAEVDLPEAPAPRIRCSREEYLAREILAEIRSEYYDGETRPMPPSNWRHVLTTNNLLLWGLTELEETELRPFHNIVRVRIGDNYFYPDLIVCPDEPDLGEEKHVTLRDANALFEVLSAASEQWDRETKFAEYSKLPGLRDYLLVSQNAPHVEHYRRPSASEPWALSTYNDMESVITLLSDLSGGPVSLPLSRIYERVEIT